MTDLLKQVAERIHDLAIQEADRYGFEVFVELSDGPCTYIVGTTAPEPTIDRTVPVSREDYDRMADQRDAYRAALVQAETYIAACKQTAAAHNVPEDLHDCLEIDDLSASLEQVEQLATVGLRAVRKALKP